MSLNFNHESSKLVKKQSNGNGSTEFPIEVFPPEYQEIIRETSEAFSVPPQIPGVAFLVGSAACTGNSVRVEAKTGWQEFPNIFTVSVGASGEGKSPAARAIYEPIYEIEEWRRGEDANAIGDPAYQSHFEGFPQWRDVIVDDVTLPALSSVLAENPRGVLWYRDELAGFFSEAHRNEVLGGRIRTAYDSGPWRVTRVSEDRTFHIPRATVSMTGTIQPKILARIFTENDVESGFLPRFLFFRSDSDVPRSWTNAAFTPKRRNSLKSHYLKLLSIDYENRSEKIPNTVQLTPDALASFVKFYNRSSLWVWLAKPNLIGPFKMKVRGHVLRLAIILLLCEFTAGDVSTLEDLEAETMEKAIKLAKYFTRETRKVYEIIFRNASPLEPKQLRVAKAIVSLSPQIKSGLLATQEIATQCNQQLPPEFQLSVKQVGKAAASLGLQMGQHMPGQNIRGVGLTPKDVARLRSML